MEGTYTELKMVTDRTAEDVSYALSLQEKGWEQLSEAQKQEWLAGLKGCLNAADLNRIEAALTELSALLEEPLTWSQHVPSIPDKRYFKELSENLARLRNHREYLYTGTPALPTLPWNTWQKLNAVERILKDIHTVYWANQLTGSFCGDIYAGEQGLL